jgi:hypothetical protein
MSRLTRCNFCTLQRIKAYADRTGQKLLLEPDADGWIAVYTYRGDPDDKVWCATFVKLTDHSHRHVAESAAGLGRGLRQPDPSSSVLM